MSASYVIRFFFEWGGGVLWADNDRARDTFGYDIDPEDVGLSPATCQKLEQLSIWHDTALNRDYPPDPGPWRQEECDRFNAESHAIYATIQQELGADFAVLYHHHDLSEDPDLDAYLADPQGFKRA